MKQRKTILRLTVIVLALGAVCLFLRACVDAPAPDDADLRITFDEIPDEENALTYFEQAVEKLNWPAESEQERRVRDLLREESWDDALAAEIVAQNEGVLDLIEQGLACARFQVPEMKNYDAILPGLASWRAIASLGAIRAECLFRQANEEEAFEQAMQVVRLGRRFQEGRGCFVNYLIGIAIKGVGQKRLRLMLARTTLEPDVLRPYIARLAECRASEQGLADAMKIEYTCAADAVDGLASGRYTGRDFDLGKWAELRLLLKPNKTKRRCAHTLRIIIANIPKSYADATPLDFDRGDTTWWMIRAVASGNSTGQSLYYMLIPALRLAHQNKCRENCSIAATQILIALKCYKATHGALPDSLDQLVPDYFEQIPLDDFDGKPMKYSRAKHVVYAVGTDLTDNGGIANRDREGIRPEDGYDLIFKIAF